MMLIVGMLCNHVLDTTDVYMDYIFIQHEQLRWLRL